MEWLAPKYAMFLRTLRNPIYTGTYVCGVERSVAPQISRLRLATLASARDDKGQPLCSLEMAKAKDLLDDL